MDASRAVTEGNEPVPTGIALVAGIAPALLAVLDLALPRESGSPGVELVLLAVLYPAWIAWWARRAASRGVIRTLVFVPAVVGGGYVLLNELAAGRDWTIRPEGLLFVGVPVVAIAAGILVGANFAWRRFDAGRAMQAIVGSALVVAAVLAIVAFPFVVVILGAGL